jgi:heme/copper-type cytochrome/quinol oxidase subunit 2
MNKTEFKKLTTILTALTIILMTIPTITTTNALAADQPPPMGVPVSPEDFWGSDNPSSSPDLSQTQNPLVNTFRDIVLVVVVVGVILAVVVVCVLLLRKRKNCVATL